MRRKPTVFTIRDKLTWKDMYEAGLNSGDIARKYGTSRNVITINLHKLGVKVRDKSFDKLGEKNPNWSGDSVSRQAVHRWVRRHLEKPELCSRCVDRKAIDLANISQTYNPETYTRDFNNWIWLCRKCHMEEDGRLQRLNGR